MYKLKQMVFIHQCKKPGIVVGFDDNKVIVKYEDKIAPFEPSKLSPYRDKRETQKKDSIMYAKLRNDAIIPSKRYEDGCYDIYANFEQNEIKVLPGKVVLVPTGIASAFSPKYRINCKRERGSTGKIGLAVMSGQIDSGYRGEWFIALYNPTDASIIISKEVNETTAVSDQNGTVIYYPYTKAICQAAIEYVPNVEIVEIPFSELESIPSLRGKTKLGQSGK